MSSGIALRNKNTLPCKQPLGQGLKCAESPLKLLSPPVPSFTLIPFFSPRKFICPYLVFCESSASEQLKGLKEENCRAPVSTYKSSHKVFVAHREEPPLPGCCYSTPAQSYVRHKGNLPWLLGTGRGPRAITSVVV